MALTRLHFDTVAEIGQTIKKEKRVQIQLVYLGQNTYNVKAIDLTDMSLIKDPKAVICNKKVEFPAIKGNGRKAYARLRDLALNVTENRTLDYYRKEK